MFFYEPSHKYYKNSIEEKYFYISGSKISELYKEEYDSFYWSLRKAYEYLLYRDYIDKTFSLEKMLNEKPKASKSFYKSHAPEFLSGDYRVFDHLRNFVSEDEAAIIQKQILLYWDEINEKSLLKGDFLHNHKEVKALSLDKVVNPFSGNELKVIKNKEWIDEYTVKRIVDINNLTTGYYPEIIVDFGIFLGTIDKLYIEEDLLNDKWFYIDDWKTNKKLDFENPFQKMKPPIQHLDDCNWNHYRLQLSLYCNIMIKLGYKYGGSRLTHCILNEETGKWSQIPYEFQYLEKEIESLIRDIKLTYLI